MKTNQTFIVDIGETMVGTRTIGNREDRQMLICKCGKSQSFNFKIKRSIIKNFDELINGDDSADKIVCKSCGTVYDNYNKINMLTPDKEDMFSVKYYIKNKTKEKSKSLYKAKSFVKFDSAKSKMVFREEIDMITFDETSKIAKIIINNFNNNNLSSIHIEDTNSEKNISSELNLNTIDYLKDFFKYCEFVNYVGLEFTFDFIKSVDKYVSDLEELKSENFINFIYSNNKIISEKNKKGEIEFFQKLSSGFDDGKFVKKRLNVGNYLRCMEDISKLFFSVISFPNLTTVFLTKDYEFLKSFMQGTNLCDVSVYKKLKATYPTKIIEISTNYSKEGQLKKNDNDSKKKTRYLKISNLIYKNINTSNDMNILLDVYSNNLLSKQEIESLFQKYDNDRVYKMFRQLMKGSENEIKLSFAHVIHIMNYNLDDVKTEFLTLYIDTIRMISLLDQPENTILKIRNFKELTDLHDDYTARYNAIKDERKADFYKKAVESFKHLDCVLNDFEFTVVPTIEELNKEGLKMQHCIYTYLDRICEKKYLAVNVRHTISNERATAGFQRESGTILKLEQLKGFYNSRASRDMIDTITKFAENNKIKMVNYASDFSPNESLKKRMDDYLTDKEVNKIREEREVAKEKAKEAKKPKNLKRKQLKKNDNNDIVVKVEDSKRNSKTNNGIWGLFDKRS